MQKEAVREMLEKPDLIWKNFKLLLLRDTRAANKAIKDIISVVIFFSFTQQIFLLYVRIMQQSHDFLYTYLSISNVRC